MPLRRLLAVFCIAVMVLPGAQALAQESRGGILALLPDDASSRHTLEAGGVKLDYTATAGTTTLRDGQGALTAAIFSVDYRLEPADAARPVTFVFNGGPGAAAAYLHLGAIGPKALQVAPDGSFLPPPQRLTDNPDSWLAFSDLVFVDPPGTGYSRAAEASKEEDFYGVDRDASAMAAFVRLWLQNHGRTASPVVLAGESYGGFRAARLARTLQEETGIAPSGVVLISPALEFARLFPDSFDVLAPALLLPSLAATRLEAEGVRGADALAERLKPVEDFALGPYLTALATVRKDSAALAGEVASLTGLDPALVARNAGRVDASLFAREFRRGEGKTVSLYDATITAPDVAPDADGRGSPDPVLDRSVPVLTSAFVAYVRDGLGFRTDLTYRLLNGDIARRWDYGIRRQGYAGVLDDLQTARALQPALRVLVVHGYTDLVTPYRATRHLLDQLPELAGAEPIRMVVTEGGHMMYLRPDARRTLVEEARRVVAGPAN